MFVRSVIPVKQRIISLVAVVSIVFAAIFLIMVGKRNQTTNLLPSPTFSPSPSQERTWSPLELLDVTGGLLIGGGVVTKHVIGGEFILSVSAKLTELPEDAWYAAWMIRREPQLDTIALGKLIRTSDAPIWSTIFRAAVPYHEYREIIVTMERKDDNVPEKTILRGVFPIEAQ